MTQSGAGGAMRSTGIVSFAHDGTAATKLTEHVGSQEFGVVYVDKVLYFKVVSAGTGWLAIRQGASDALAKQFGPLVQAMQQSQRGGTAGSPDAVWKVVAVTPAAITYRTHATQRQVAAALDKTGMSQVQAPPGGEDIVEAIAPNGLVRQVDTIINGAVTLQVDYRGWGPAVTISAPPDSTDA
ncbi:hypothetical protein EFY87_10675 [Flexivirga caeni]|uniref:Uncharacterized protein n=2 Tax=Flexivirga caeni TaxID=2294115 RepID=A0A3M9M7S5_9MICO|nr:hypothetical protein EFY87_10675 [Flexivirga caeni]